MTSYRFCVIRDPRGGGIAKVLGLKIDRINDPSASKKSVTHQGFKAGALISLPVL